jgi:hypothetical protein
MRASFQEIDPRCIIWNERTESVNDNVQQFIHVERSTDALADLSQLFLLKALAFELFRTLEVIESDCHLVGQSVKVFQSFLGDNVTCVAEIFSGGLFPVNRARSTTDDQPAAASVGSPPTRQRASSPRPGRRKIDTS